jgi:hypothetical protein
MTKVYRVYYDIYKSKKDEREWVYLGQPFKFFACWCDFENKYFRAIHGDDFIKSITEKKGTGSCSESLVSGNFCEDDSLLFGEVK